MNVLSTFNSKLRKAMFRFVSALFLFVLFCLPASAQDTVLPKDDFYVPAGSRVDGPSISANDNRKRAGSALDGVHTVRLVVARGLLFPEDDAQPGLWVEAVGESADRPQIPAPLLRARTGESFSLTLVNALPDSSITWFGLHTRPIAAPDSLVWHPVKHGSSPSRQVHPVRICTAPGLDR